MTASELIPSKLVAYDAEGLLSGKPGWRLFRDPVNIIQAVTLADVPKALQRVEQQTRAGLTAAGFLSYEAAPAFDTALQAHASGRLPLLWFGLYAASHAVTLPSPADQSFHLSPWQPSVTIAQYHDAIQRIKEAIARGETYQVNYTWRCLAEFSGDPWAFFLALCRSQRDCYGVYLDLGEHVLCSASPELFFLRRQDLLTCRPMKGTIGRGLTCRDDHEQAVRLQTSAKDRAENVMIVDMMRSDLGKISKPGQVAVPRLFEVEQYDTLWQMTSTVTARSEASLPEIFRALFPCASITGAPKVRTSQIIKELEPAPRGIYTGCLGFVTPAGDAQFNVAIRTAHLDRCSAQMVYGTGGGITWDSDPADEYRECLTKALLLTTRRPEFQLLETLLWKPDIGYFLLERHLTRLCASARYFGIPLERATVEDRLTTAANQFAGQRHRVRCLVDDHGACHLDVQPLPRSFIRHWRVALALQPIDQADRFLYHKTTWRSQYDNAKASLPMVDDVLLWNSRGEITESTIANIVVRFAGALLTPPVACGLLAGTYREALLASGRIRERVIRKEELAHASALYLINSVRGWLPAKLVTAVIGGQICEGVAGVGCK